MLKNAISRIRTLSMKSVCRTFFLAAMLIPCAAGAEGGECGVTIAGINFDTYNPLGRTPTEAQGSITVTCSGPARGKVTVNTGGSQSFRTRTMTGDRERIEYNLYADNLHATVWGNGEPGTVTGSFTFGEGGGLQIFLVYGSIPPKQDVYAPQIFRDSPAVTILW